MISDTEPRGKASERGEHLTLIPGECLPGCRICCKQQPPEIVPSEQLENQAWDFSQETNKENPDGVIGEGGFSVVFLETLHLHPEKPVLCAVKRLQNSVYGRGLTVSKKNHETEILKELQKKDDWHRNHRSEDCNLGYRYMVSYLGTYTRNQQIHIVMEYMAQSDLKHYMDMPWQEHNTRIVIKQLLSGLQFVHECGFAHRDLKPLVGSDIMSVFMNYFSDFIGDFGAAKVDSNVDPMKTMIGTWAHQAPEVLSGKPYTLAVDIWSLGTIFFRLLTGTPLFPDRAKLLTRIIKYDMRGEHSPRNDLLAQGIKSEAAIDLVVQMLQVCPEDRPSAEDALSHRWFNNPSGMETQVTPELYSHFVKVLSGPRLRRLIDVQPVENGPSIVSSPTVDETRPSTGQSPTASRQDSLKRTMRRCFSVKKH